MAMIRYTSSWSGIFAGNVLLILVLTVSFLAIATGVFVYHSVKEIRNTAILCNRRISKPVIISLIFLVVLLFYPENIRQSIVGALFTIIVGAVLLFMPVWAWGEFLLPIAATQSKTVAPKWLWGFIVLAGFFAGFVVVSGELTAGGENPDLAGKASVISVYIGSEVAGLVIGYSFLGKLLGIFQELLAVQQSMHRMPGILRGLQTFSWLRVFPASKQSPRPPQRQ
jgi:hypothetical protein